MSEELEKKNKELLEEKRKEKEKREEAEKKAKDAEDKLAALEKEKTEKEEADLKEKGKWKELAEANEKKAKDAEKALKEQGEQIVRATKIGAISQELDKLGVNADRKGAVLRLANLDDVKFDEATKVVTGASEHAKSLQSQMPELFGSKPTLPQDGGKGGGGSGTPAKMSKEWWEGLSLEDQKKFRKDYMTHLSQKK